VSGRPLAAVAGFATLGLGCSNIVPVLFSAAGRSPGVASPRALALVTVLGYSAFLAGPPLIGLAAQATSLRAALGLLVIASGLIALCASVVDNGKWSAAAGAAEDADPVGRNGPAPARAEPGVSSSAQQPFTSGSACSG
jgi:hypothetical protein